MKGLLIIAHGSKRGETKKIVDSIVVKVKTITGNQMVEPAYLEFSSPDIVSAAEHMISMGVTEIYAVPMFVFDGIHVTKVIPSILEGLQIKFPNVKIKLGKHLGDDNRLAQILCDNAKEIDF